VTRALPECLLRGDNTAGCACPAHDEVVMRLQVGRELALIELHPLCEIGRPTENARRLTFQVVFGVVDAGAEHRCIDYAYACVPGTWRFTSNDGESATVRPSGPLRVNNGDAMLPALIAGTGVGVLPEFIVRAALSDGRLERLLPDWPHPAGAVYWVTPAGCDPDGSTCSKAYSLKEYRGRAL
jgi:DNA-binding transcriptional LysR family regulator